MKKHLSGLVQIAKQKSGFLRLIAGGQIYPRYKLHSQIKLLANSQLFDKQWYLAQYPDVAASGVDPLTHYLLSGALEGRDPHPLFNTAWYIEQCPKGSVSGMNPLVHFITSGSAKGYNPNPLFDTDWYSKQYPDVAISGINPLLHFIAKGADKDYDPGPFFSTKSYRNICPNLSINPLACYLRHGTAWLKKESPATANLGPLRRFNSRQSNNKLKVLFVGHDGSPTGAPVLLLNIVRYLKKSFDIEAAIILLTDGPLQKDFADLAPTYVVDKDYKTDKDYERFRHLVLQLWKEGYDSAICNTAVTGKCTEILYQAGFIVVSAIHEMSSVIHALKVEEECKTIACYAHNIVFPADIVRNDFEKISGSLGGRAIISPQGLLQAPVAMPAAKEQVCDLLKIPRDSMLVLAAGLGDLRKGLDLYLQVARHIGQQDNRFHFIWIGNIAANLDVWFKRDMDIPLLQRYFHHIPFTDNLALYYQAADVFVLPSREDPFPTVVIEALANGLPVVAFDKCGGYIDLLACKQNGELIPYGDIESMAAAIVRIAANKEMHTTTAKIERSDPVIKKFGFKNYACNMLQLLEHTLQAGKSL